MSANKLKGQEPQRWREDSDLDHSSAGVQEDAAFGFFRDLLVFVEVHDVGVVCQLSQLKKPSLKRLQGQKDNKSDSYYIFIILLFFILLLLLCTVY